MKQEMKSTARLAVTAGLCTSLALGGLPLEAIAAEVVVDPAQAAAPSAADAPATDVADAAGGGSDESTGDGAVSTDASAEAPSSSDSIPTGDSAKAGSEELGDPADSGNGAGAASGVTASALTTAPAPVAEPQPTDIAQVIASDGTVRGDYGSLNAAVEAAQDGDTVKLLKDTIDRCNINGITMTLDLNGKILTATEGKNCIQLFGAHLTVMDSSVSGVVPVVSDGYKTVVYESGKLTTTRTGVMVLKGSSLVLKSGTIESTGNVGVFAGLSGNGSGSFTMDGGYVHAYSGAVGVINEGSKAQINDGVIVSEQNAPVMGNGTQGQGGTEITVSGGTLISRCTTDGYNACGIYHPQAGKLTITGGDIFADGGAGVLMRAGSADISGGTITASGTEPGWIGDKDAMVPCSGIVVDHTSQKYPGEAESDVVSISGNAVIRCDTGLPAVQAMVSDGESAKGDIVITGGTFDGGKPDDMFIDEELQLEKGDDGSFVVVEKKVAQIGDKTYPSLAKALDAAQDGDTVTLLEDTLSDGGAVVAGERSVTLDLNGKTLDCGSGQIVVEDKANLTFTGGGELKNSATVDSVSSYVVLVRKGAHATFDGAGIAGAYCLYALGDVDIARANMEATGGCAIAVNGSARVVVGSKDATAAENNKNVVVTSANNCVSTQAKESSKDSKVTVYGGTFTGATNPDNPSDPWNCGPVYWASHGTLDIRDGVFTTAAATAAVLQKNGTVKVSGGTFEAKDGFKIDATQKDTTEIVTEITDGTFTGTRAGIYVNAGTGGPIDYAKNFSVKVRGGTFKGGDKERAIYVKPAGAAAAGTKPLEISGGAFDEVVDEGFCAPNYVPDTTPDADGNYTVEVPEDKRVAEIDGRAYPSLQEALDAAKDGQAVTLLKNTELMKMHRVSGKSVVLDLGGKVLKQAVGGYAIVALNGADLTIRNGSVFSDFENNVLYAQQATVRTEQLTVNADNCIQVGNRQDGGVYWGELILGEGTVLNAKTTGVTVAGPYASDGIPSEGARLTKLTVNDGVTIVSQGGFAVAGNGTCHGTEINILGGELTSGQTAAVYHPQVGTLTVSGGTITGVSGIEIRSGELHVSGDATIRGTGPFSVGPNDSGSTTSGVGIAIAQHNTKLPISVEVTGAPKVSGVYGLYESNPQNNSDADLEKVDISIKGGTFETTDKENGAPVQSEDVEGFVSGGSFNEPLDGSQCADGYGPVQQPDGSFGVSTEQSYTVKHLFEKVDSDDYVEDESLSKTETLTGAIGRPTEAEPVNVEGFTAQPVAQQTIAADGSTVVEIRYDRARHTVSFDSKGGSAAAGQTVKYGAQAKKPSDPTKEGSTFLGWYIAGTFNKFDFNTPVTEDIQLVAHWVLNTYTVTLDANGGEPIGPIEMSHGYKLAKPTATRAGYTLTGWNDADGKNVTFPVTVTGDLELTAQWKLDAPKVALTADEAEPGVHAGDTVTLIANPEHALADVTYTYQWYKGRTAIDGATEKTLEVSNKDGEYTVDVVAHDGKNTSAAATSNSITLSFEKRGVAVSFAQSAVEKHANEIGGAFVNDITLRARAIGEVTYESSDEKVAAVDAKTGEVTVKGVGAATITAKVAETETHEAAEASYKLTVTDHDAGTWKTVKPATCTEAGEEQRVCGACGEVLETRAIEKLAHAAAHVPAKAATCTEDGNIEHWSCESCGKLFADAACTDEIELTDTVEKALGHDYAEIVVDPTCTEGGYTVHECQRCGDSHTDSKTEALGHAEKLAGAADATCTEDGYTGDMVCSVCGEVLQKGEVVPAAGHKVGAWKVTKEPTCTEVGREERVCSVCGEKESREIPALVHKLEAVAEIPATIDAAGVKAHYKCTACGELFLDAEGKQGVDVAGLVIEKLEAVTVTFDDCFDPDTDQIVIRLAKGGVIADEDLPADPEHAGYEFAGWFLYDTTTHSWGDAFDPTASVTADLLVGAKWKKVDDGTGDSGSTEKPADKPTKPSDEPGSGDKDALVQTGDSAFAQIVAAFSAGVAAIGAGLFSRRRRNE